MQDWQQWIEENRPAEDPDYLRITEVTTATEAEMRKGDPRQVLNRRFDYDTTLLYGKRRTDEVSQKVKLENPGPNKLLPLLGASWAEGFAFGALSYSQEKRGRRAEAFLDRVALANINHKLSHTDEAGRGEIFSEIISMKALSFVSTVRSFQACNVLAQQAPVATHQMVNALVASHWLDGFLVGLVFQEMGGHREG